MSHSNKYDEQIQRIKIKLKQARSCDSEFEVFGSSSHRYNIGPPISEIDIARFEAKHGISLPSDYVAFLTKVGHGSPSKAEAAAGPFYGIAPLDTDSIAIGGSASLPRPPLVHPKLTDEEWQEHSRRLYIDYDHLSEAEYDREQERLYAGLLTIGHQGCQSHHTLVVTGPDKGRVVNVDIDGNKPRFAFETNFLDWYERWLDEIISGLLLQKQVAWFGYKMGGDDLHLMQVYKGAADQDTKYEALSGLTRLIDVQPQTCKRLDEICGEENQQIRTVALHALTKFDATLARPHLERFAHADDLDRLAACQAILWYSRQSAPMIETPLLEHLPEIQDEETFSFALFVLEEAGADFVEAVVPFATHANESFRRWAFYYLGKALDKTRYLDIFHSGLRDDATSVVHATLQALAGVTDTRLLPAYKQVADRYPTEEGYVRINLEHRLREFGFKDIEAFERGDQPETTKGWRNTLRNLLKRLRK